MTKNGIAIVNAKIKKEKQMSIYCPSCDEPTTQSALDKWEMCYNCERQSCPECGRAFCNHDQ